MSVGWLIVVLAVAAVIVLLAVYGCISMSSRESRREEREARQAAVDLMQGQKKDPCRSCPGGLECGGADRDVCERYKSMAEV